MFINALLFTAGILVVQQFPILPTNNEILVSILLLVGLISLRYWRWVMFITGVIWACIFAQQRLADTLPDALQGQVVLIEGVISSLPQADDRRVRFNFKVKNQLKPFPRIIRLSWYFPQHNIQAGQYWRFAVKLKKPHGRLNPGGFDYERWLFVHHIQAMGYIKNSPPAELLSTLPWWQNLTVSRQIINNQLTELLADNQYKGIIKALTIGVKDDIDDHQWQVYRTTGIVHLLAISGLHIGLIAGLAYWFVLKISLSLSLNSPQQLAATTSILIAVCYAALAGFSLPTQRALLMLVVAMLAISWQRHVLPWHIFSLALFAVLLFDPLAVLSAGFWLSFFAVGVIIFGIAGRLGTVSTWLNSLMIQARLALGLMPLLAFYFQQISVIAPIANLIIVPVVSILVVPICLLAVLIMGWIPILSHHLFNLVEYIFQLLWIGLSWLAEQPWTAIRVDTPSFQALLFALIGSLLLLAPQGIPARYLGVFLILPLFWSQVDRPQSGTFRMTLLDVGQGLSAVVETKHHTLVFDTGARYSARFDMGKAVVLPFLHYRSIDRIDQLVISHSDNDHIGGAKSLLTEINVDKLLTSVPALMQEYHPKRCQTGQYWIWDQVKFQVLSPDKILFPRDNNNSCVIKVTDRSQQSLLLTGDIEQTTEHWLVEHFPSILTSHILLAPHHGSQTSSSLLFLKQVNPDVILIPSGYKNRFSFPHVSVIARYQQLNIPWLNTATAGAITVETNRNGYSFYSERARFGHYWNRD